MLSNNTITKTEFIAGMTCEKMYWFLKKRKDLIPAQSDDIAKEGETVGELAKGLFDHFVTVGGTTMKEKVKRTKELIAAGTPNIAEASFFYDGLYCQVDILVNHGDSFEINEVKAVTNVRTKKGALGNKFLYDVGFQHYVVAKTGLKIGKIKILHLNGEYKKQGDLDIGKLFVADDVTEESTAWAIENDKVAENVNRLRNFLAANPEEPDESVMNTNCAPISDPCTMRERCMAQLECCDVWNLNGTFCKPPTKLRLFKAGIASFADIAESESVKNERVIRQINTEISGEDFVDKDAIGAFLNKISYPIAYLDFETYQLAVPEYDGQWPYEKMPFQYSLDIAMKPGGKLVHKEFLGDENEDPRRELAEKLIKDIPKGSCVIVYNQKFEKGILKDLAMIFSDLADDLNEINKAVCDLMDPFIGVDYYTKDMEHSYSIKKVLPALYPGDPNLDYSKLPGVKNGKEAMNRFLELRDMDKEEREREREGMLKYCGLDTYAMVMVHKALEDAAI